MHLIFNELSFYPLAENGHSAELRLKQFLKTFKTLVKRYGFNHVRFPVNHRDQKITESQTFYEWIFTVTNRRDRDLILSICKSPYLDDLENNELVTFFESRYCLNGENAPTKLEPIGLPVAYIKSIPSISFDSHQFWRSRKIIVHKTGVSDVESTTFFTYNVCLDTDLNTHEINEWADTCLAKFITTEDGIKKYLGYTKYEIALSVNFVGQFFDWKENNFEQYKYLLLLMKDIELHPFTGGMGHTENLKNRSKEASKRVTQIDRLSYTIENNLVTFLACKGHYTFH